MPDLLQEHPFSLEKWKGLVGWSTAISCSLLLSQALGWGLPQSHKRLLVELLLLPFQTYFHTVRESLNVSNQDTLAYSQLALCVSAVQE